MARITVEDCLTQVDNRFSLVHLAAKRVRQLKKGDNPRIKCKNREVVTALREIAGGIITPAALREIEESRSRAVEHGASERTRRGTSQITLSAEDEQIRNTLEEEVSRLVSDEMHAAEMEPGEMEDTDEMDLETRLDESD